MRNLFGENEEKPRRKPKGEGKRKRVDFAVEVPFEQQPCDACGRPIVFQKIPGGSTMPLHVESRQERLGKLYMESHFAHCTEAKRFRRPKTPNTCAARSCSTKVPKDAPFCGECWAKVPMRIRHTIRDRFQADQDRGGEVSQAYEQALELARVVLDR